MPPLLELQYQFSAVEPGYGLRQTMPGNVSADQVMCPAGISHLHLADGNVHGSLAPDEMANDFLEMID